MAFCLKKSNSICIVRRTSDKIGILICGRICVELDNIAYLTELIFRKTYFRNLICMAYIKEQRQLRFNVPRTDNADIKSLHKGLVELAERTISDQRQTEQQYLSQERTNFMICRNCSWCASILSAKHFITEKCPSCSIDMLESIPLAQNENFKIN